MSKLDVLKRRKLLVATSKNSNWDVKSLRCATCAKWLPDGRELWDTVPEGVIIFCSRVCEVGHLNREEPNILY